MSGPNLLVHPQHTPLTGHLPVPGDKSISHRAVMLASIADGDSRIRGWLPAGDTLATLEIVRMLGVRVDVMERSGAGWDLLVKGRGKTGLSTPNAPLDCRNAGTCMRLLAGILVGQPFASILDGSEQLRNRPMRRIISPLREMGADIDAEGERAPLAIHPANLRGIAYRMGVASAQVKSAILLAGLYATGETRVFQPGPARDHSERLLSAMGADVATEGGWVSISPVDQLSPLDIEVPGDVSSAAFLAAAAALVPQSRIRLTNIGANRTRTGFLDMLQAMGAQFTSHNERSTGGEPVADYEFASEELHATTVQGNIVVRGIDEFPIWAIAATQAIGSSQVRDAAELRVKEVDRIAVLCEELRKMGVPTQEHDDGFTVAGPVRLQAAQLDCRGDHRLGMALAVAGMLADGPTTIRNAQCIEDSFPDFAGTMESLGVKMVWVS
jgi:3-phosphoshikimate 1-carboxyvinyltransferase